MKVKLCKNCGKPRGHDNPLISLCKQCSYKKSEANKKQTRIKQVSDKKKQFLKDTGGEREVFRKILIDRQDNGYLTCSICGNKFLIENAGPSSFAHILSKGMYKHLRLFENNIAIVCNDINMNSCHNKLDGVVNKIKKDMGKEFESLIISGKDISDLIDKYKIG